MAQAVQPVLASQIYTLEPRSRQHSDAGDERRRLRFGCRAIDDDVLRGGIDFGTGAICSLSGDREVVGELAQHAAAEHLLSHSAARVFYIDTTGSFSPRRLYNILVAHRRNGGVETAVATRQRPHMRANKMLDRVHVMRVFDFAGVMEAVFEISVNLRDAASPPGSLTDPRPTGRFIVDSQRDHDDEEEGKTTEDSEEPSLIVISNMPAALSPLVHSSGTEGHAMLVHTLRTLHQLTQQHALSVLVLNGTIDASSEQRPSAFAGVVVRPALGRVFAHQVDVSLMACRLQRDDGQDVDVLEVLADRHGGRTGRWAGFELRGVELKEVV